MRHPLFLSGQGIISPAVMKGARSVIGRPSPIHDRRMGDTIRSDYWRLKAAGLETLPNGVTQPIGLSGGGSRSGSPSVASSDAPARSEPTLKRGRKRLLAEMHEYDADAAERGTEHAKRHHAGNERMTFSPQGPSRLTNGHEPTPWKHTRLLPPTPPQQLRRPAPSPKAKGNAAVSTRAVTIDLTSDSDDEGGAATKGEERDEDEELFAKVHALQDAMDEGIAFYRGEVGVKDVAVGGGGAGPASGYENEAEDDDDDDEVEIPGGSSAAAATPSGRPASRPGFPSFGRWR